MTVILAVHLAVTLCRLYARRQAGYVLRAASVLGAVGDSAKVAGPVQRASLRGPSDGQIHQW